MRFSYAIAVVVNVKTQGNRLLFNRKYIIVDLEMENAEETVNFTVGCYNGFKFSPHGIPEIPRFH